MFAKLSRTPLWWARFASTPLPTANRCLFATKTDERDRLRATTILAVRKGNDLVMVGDGQVSMGETVLKGNAKKVRRIAGGKVLLGFAGATADAFTLMERLEGKLEEYPGQLLRAAVELAKAWRTDKYLRNLNALLIVCDKDVSLTVTGNGDVVEPSDGVIGIGSGGIYATSAARALLDIEGWTAHAIAMKAMKIAADTCVYTNHNFTVETMDCTVEDIKKPEEKKDPTLPPVLTGTGEQQPEKKDAPAQDDKNSATDTPRPSARTSTA